MRLLKRKTANCLQTPPKNSDIVYSIMASQLFYYIVLRKRRLQQIFQKAHLFNIHNFEISYVYIFSFLFYEVQVHSIRSHRLNFESADHS